MKIALALLVVLGCWTWIDIHALRKETQAVHNMLEALLGRKG